ncbi:MAG: cysteine synthase A [Nitrospirota bacterium]
MIMHKEITELIGKTPLVRLNRLSKPGSATIYGKVEFFNPGGSVKDRICLNMINEAERQGKLKPGGTIVEPTSGNTGIGLALVSAVRGYKLILVMPESMSMERASLLSSYGAQLVLTPAWEGMKGSIKEAESILAQNPSYFMPDQFSNPANPAMHRMTTAPEILDALDGKIDAFVAAVGTGGTIMGTGRRLKEFNKDIKVIAVEPESAFHGLEGLKHMASSIVPGIYHEDELDSKVPAPTEESYEMSRRLAREEGLLVGQSAGAAMWGAMEVAKSIKKGVIVAIFPDNGDKYLSTRLWES